MIKKMRGKKRGKDSESDEDDTMFMRCPSSCSNYNSNNKNNSGSGGLAPSKSTVYVSNLDYNLTNSDIFTIFSTFGKVARVTVLKDRHSRHSKGVAFVLFVSISDAHRAAANVNGKLLNGRTLSASIAADNGRAPEFIRRRVYRDKSRCYECGDHGHLSYECPHNQLGPRDRPVPKRSRRAQPTHSPADCEDSDGGNAFEDDNWASVVDTRGAQERHLSESGCGSGIATDSNQRTLKEEKRKKKALKTHEDAEAWIKNVAFASGHVIVALYSENRNKKQLPKVVYTCKCSRTYDDPGKKAIPKKKKRRKMGTKKCQCPFGLYVKFEESFSGFGVRVKCGIHNHPPGIAHGRALGD